jgi:hypothetical protein
VTGSTSRTDRDACCGELMLGRTRQPWPGFDGWRLERYLKFVGWREKHLSRPKPGKQPLLTDAELLDDVFIGFRIVALQIVEQTAATAHHLEQPAARCVILGVGLEVLGQFADPLAQNRDLHLWTTGVGPVRAVRLDYGLFSLGR